MNDTDDFLHELFPGADPGLLAQTSGAGKPAQLEPNPGHGILAKVPVEKRTGGHFLVRVTSVRKILLDEDNLCEKFHVDLLRYAGVIPEDKAGTAKIETTQRKAQKGEEPHVFIEVYHLPP